MNNLYSYPPIFTGIVLLILGIIVVVKKSINIVNWLYFVLCFVTFIWLSFYGFAYLVNKDGFLLRNLFKIGYVGIIFIPILWFHFVVTFLHEKNKILKIIIFTSYCFGAYFVFLLFFTNSFVTGYYKYFWGYYPICNRSLWHPVFLFFYCSLWSCCLTLLLLKRSKVQNAVEKTRLNYLLWSFIVVLPGIIDFVPNYGVQIYPFAWISVGGCIIITAYAIIKYRFLDVNIIFTRAGIFIAVYSIVLGIPLILIYSLQNVFASILGVNWWIIPYFCSVVLSTLGPFLYFYVEERAEAKLMREQRTYQNILKSASRGMIRIKDLNLLLNLIVRVVVKTVRIKHAFVYLLDEEIQSYKLAASRSNIGIADVNREIQLGSSLIWQLSSKREAIVTEEEIMRMQDDSKNIAIESIVKQLVSLKASLVIPSFVEDRMLGILVLGEKRSKKSFSQDDINVFSVLANQAALAIENAQFYDEIKRTHEQLFQAEKMATIGTMADGLSHQINNRFHALSLIAGDSLDMLKTFDWSGCNEGTKQVMTDLKSALEKIENNVLQGGEIVKGILKYSRPGDSGFESVDFKDVLNGAIEMVQYKIKLKEIDIVQNIPADLPKLHGNLTQLQEVFFNLIDNAYDAIKERQMTLKEEGYRGKIEVTADRSSNSIEIRVTDNGIGVKDFDKKKLFAPFFTTKATAKKGTGLGLYVIEKIIASHNGKIDIESAYKSGTRFIINLPTTPSAT